MMMLFRKPPAINGTEIPARRFTVWAAVYFALFVALPVLGLAFLLDFAFYLLFRNVFGACYAVLCLFD